MEPALLATLNRYFRTRLGFANGVAYSGEGVGAMVFPLLLTTSTEAFSVRGALLILGGIWLNNCVLGALLRPPPITRVTVQPSAEVKDSDDQKTTEPEPAMVLQQMNSEAPVSTSKHDIPNWEERDPDQTEGETMNLRATPPRHKYTDLLRNFRLVRIIIVLFCGGISSYGVTFMFPALSLEWGSGKLYSSLTVSVAGACDTVSKLAVGYLVDTKLLSKYTIVTFLFLTAGIGAVATAFSRNIHVLMGYAVVLGLTGLNFTSMAGPLITDCVPHQAIGSAMGLYLLAYGCGISLGYPLIGKFIGPIQGLQRRPCPFEVPFTSMEIIHIAKVSPE